MRKCNKTIIEIRNITKKYHKEVLALDGLTFSVKAGSIFGLLGPNGAGKSTAIKIMTTLSQPDSGQVKLFGKDVTRYSDLVRKNIGCVAQQSTVDGESTGRENLTLQGRLYGLKGTALKSRVVEMLDRFALTDVANRLSKTYSGGMKRRLDLAMALIHRPQILFLDEPTTGLDPQARTSLWKIIKNLSTEEGLTVLLTTHYLEEADQLSDQLAIIDKGKVVIEGTAETLKGELQGDILQLDLLSSEQVSKAADILHQMDGIYETTLDERVLYLRTDLGATALPLVIAALDREGIKVTSATINRPSLNDVYLRYTGKTFDQAQKQVIIS